jgi:hypothetical protein
LLCHFEVPITVADPLLPSCFGYLFSSPQDYNGIFTAGKSYSVQPGRGTLAPSHGLGRAAEGRQIKAAAEQAKTAAAVDDAIRKGKITAGRRKHWVSLIAADPGMADVLASVPDETAVPLSEIGHGVDSEDSSALAQTAEWFR